MPRIQPSELRAGVGAMEHPPCAPAACEPVEPALLEPALLGAAPFELVPVEGASPGLPGLGGVPASSD